MERRPLSLLDRSAGGLISALTAAYLMKTGDYHAKERLPGIMELYHKRSSPCRTSPSCTGGIPWPGRRAARSMQHCYQSARPR